MRSNLKFLDLVAERELQAIEYFNDKIEIFEDNKYDPVYQINLKLRMLIGKTGRKYLSINEAQYLNIMMMCFLF